MIFSMYILQDDELIEFLQTIYRYYRYKKRLIKIKTFQVCLPGKIENMDQCLFNSKFR